MKLFSFLLMATSETTRPRLRFPAKIFQKKPVLCTTSKLYTNVEGNVNMKSSLSPNRARLSFLYSYSGVDPKDVPLVQLHGLELTWFNTFRMCKDSFPSCTLSSRYSYKSFCYPFQTSGDTVLHAAVRKKDVDIAKILVECGCPVDLQNVIKKLSLFGFQ